MGIVYRFSGCLSSTSTTCRTFGTRISTLTVSTATHSTATGTQKASIAFVATVDTKYAGFALVNQEVRIGTHGYWMDQFFVLKKYRHQRVGRLLAHSVFAALLGRWEIGQLPENLPAQAFWREVIGKYTGGRFKEHEVYAGRWQGVIQVFESTAPQ